ncbi:MAG: ABC transporter substrate-binding protein [Desulfuromonadales bacterium]|nr:ABC transporter substrate-binding protein [Desulfuromonadales bacterium]
MAMRSTVLAIVIVFLAMIVMGKGSAVAREIVDMSGRKVVVPDSIKKVYAPAPYGAYILYAVDPTMMSGLIFPLKEEDKHYLHKSVRDLPVIGGLFGQGQTANIEVLLKTKPDALLMWSDKKSPINPKMEENMKKLGIPYAYATAASLSDYPDVFLFLGRFLNREKRAKKLSDYSRRVLSSVDAAVKRVPEGKRPKVYYAEGVDGLQTECDDSIHVELLKRAGDTDVHRCHTASHMGMEKISLEQIMIDDPDVILVQEKLFFEKVFKDPAWQRIRAVRQGKVFLIPRTPFNWFDRPPSFMRILGLQWVTNLLYPKEYPLDVIREAREFYRLFLGVEVSEQDMHRIMGK